MNDGTHMPGMAAPPSNATMAMPHRRHMMMMHMTFFWGKDAEILFDGWPGRDNLGMYVLALFVIFFLAFLIEWFSNCNFLRENSSPAAGMLQTAMYGVRVGLAYLVMLAVMSFNAGVFLAAVGGHAVGFFFFGSRAFKKRAAAGGKTSDLPPMNC